MEIGDITLLAEIYLNGEIFYQEYSHTFTEKIGIDNLDKQCVQPQNNVDGVFSWVLYEDSEFVAGRKIIHARTERMK